MRVFTDAMTRYAHKFPHPPPGKYYAVDAGYPNRVIFHHIGVQGTMWSIGKTAPRHKV
ncbi:transposon protein, putative, CACTA, En/Spm sub-class [Panicum miliaceum]|uniref:Transposon protein, putative, CACTA, En/Spm sub-class n=1 Tax=Panicum miliaceum TaxID=4540 RepID=A0A3L6SK64_PANMI|nr:transposon protein, putative, CACTA, En/Spm sub-class [Panicum miliaceum]